MSKVNPSRLEIKFKGEVDTVLSQIPDIQFQCQAGLLQESLIWRAYETHGLQPPPPTGPRGLQPLPTLMAVQRSHPAKKKKKR